MADKNSPAGLKFLLEFGPIVVFFLAFRWAPVPAGGDEAARQLAQVIFATKVFVPVTVIALLVSRLLTGVFPKMAVITAIVVVIFGGLTVWLRDPVFIKMKPTIIYLTFAAILGFGLMRGQSYLRALMGEVLPLKPEGWMIFTRRFALFFLALALVNEAVWRSFDTSTWVSFKTFALPFASLAFVFAQMGLFRTYAEEPPAQD
jgi:intracellular septation protein